MELTDDFSQATDELRETLSSISKHSKRTTSQRVSDWVNEINEPDSVSHQPQTNTVEFNNVVVSFNPAVIPESTIFDQLRQATVPARSSADDSTGSGRSHLSPIGILSVSTIPRPNSTAPSFTPLSFFQPPPVNTTAKTVSSSTVPVASLQSLTRFPQEQLSVGPKTTMTQVNIQTSHVTPNLSAWTFAAPSSLLTVHAIIPQPVRGQLTLTSTSAAPIVQFER